jgi:hypothetical protein
MAKKETPTNVNTNVNNNTNVVNVHVASSRNPYVKKEKKPNWIIKAIVIATIGLISSIIIIYVKHSTATNGKPAYIQNGTPAIAPDKK